MALFNRPKREETPMNLNQTVRDMQRQGMSNDQIAQSMQRDGQNLGNITDAMNQVSMGSGAPSGPFPGQMPSIPPPNSPYGMPYPGQQQGYGSQQGDMGMPPPMGNPGMDESSLSSAQFEEVAESIIEEKWNELMKNVNKIIEWKNQMDTRFVQVEQKFSDIQHSFDELHRAVISKVNEYDQNILNVGSQVKAMEKVFSKVLPTFTETVNELGRITNFVKGDQPKSSGRKPLKKEEDDDDDIDIPHEMLHNL